VPVRRGAGASVPDPTPPGCGYPSAGALAAVEARASKYEAAASSFDSLSRVPLELACDLAPDVRRRAALQNARTLRSLARAWLDGGEGAVYPYATVSTFGFGEPSQAKSPLARYQPGDGCVELTRDDRRALSVNVVRAHRAADAFRGGVAPLVTVSGGAVHSPVVEAFMLTHLLSCDEGVPLDRILVDPCADHTHTNVRNTGALVASVGGRFAYVVTDRGIQADYLEEWTAFDLVGGSVDQRALRDFGHLVGAWRHASVGDAGGFWYTPYRFWADPGPLRDFTCQGDVEVRSDPRTTAR
jgi:hypothetical protein